MSVSAITRRVTTIMEHPQPIAVNELQGFLGIINFYRLFVLAWPPPISSNN